ncbi:ABC transporter permease [Aestuariispira ectoiniformans]|uniref:ABC transporter permease n=1 Tax=Aestuariispira ectoiniformans TaxID=2775080 RepID=UPI0021B05BE7|nr:ABC transporter permease subunit [Aestuariispira ectoiniformans]
MEHIWEFRWLLLQGTGITILVGVASLVLAIVLGLLGAWAKLSKNAMAQRAANGYTTLIRGIPDLVLMLILFFGGQQLLLDIGEKTGLWGYVEINQFTAGVGTIGFIFGAYMTETFRGAILAIPRGQIEAGIACGMSKSLIFRRIIWPQMVRYALPSFTNNWLVMIKTTALVSVLGLQELVYVANAVGRKFREPFTFLLFVLVVFLLLTAVSQLGLRKLEKKYSVGIRRG